MLKKLFLAAAFCLGFALTVQARVYSLPDYQATLHFGHRTNDGDSGSQPQKPQSCATYGLYTATSRPSNTECTKVAIPGLTCYSCTACSNSYIYNSSNCTGEYVLSGNSCGGKYNKCICNPAKYKTSADGSGCKDGEKPDTSKSCVDKTTGKTLYPCSGDPCYGLVDNSSELGCDKYYAQCPSKCEVGKTCKLTDCSAYTLSSCPSGSVCGSCVPGCGDTAPRYKVKKFSGLAFQVNSPANGRLYLEISGSDWQVDWGDGTIDTKDTHTYVQKGKYDVEITGGVTTFSTSQSSSSTVDVIALYSLNLPQIKSMKFAPSCTTLTGTIPPLPESLTNGDQLFHECHKLTGSVPKLPSGLTDAWLMFADCTSLTGKIPELPSGLTSGASMFENCTRLTGSIPQLPSTLTDAKAMFKGDKNLTGNIPPLPSGITLAEHMFDSCTGLTGSIPSLPTALERADYMFYNCNKLSGNIPALPASLYDASSMFAGCSGLTGSIPTLPSPSSYKYIGLKNATAMFAGCSGLTGSIPNLPESLNNVVSMFANCTKLTGTIPALPSKITSGEYMFDSCSGLTGAVPQLPTTLTNGNSMFAGCQGLTGSVPTLPSGLSNGRFMFLSCSGLTGKTPAKPSGLTTYESMFSGTKVTNDGSWPSGAW